ncbi:MULTISPECIES: hypothetical protein [unclassified Bacteroides]|uniref:hypothetical protein n=1 Tax=unclassified Bacteroides TaxID=2646097 RepID=UPI000EFFEE64|nr:MULTISPECIES: hypothetical protein [unclassified Bacteroides]
MELQKSLLNEVAAILDDEEMTEKALRSIRRIKAKVAKEQKVEEEIRPYTPQELKAELDERLARMRAGEELSSEQVFKRMEEKYSWLCE